MGKRPTIEQLAMASGVSVATVDRVLNRRLPVRPETASRVYEAASRIGFHAAELIGQRIRAELPELRLGFLLLKSSQRFYGEFARELERSAAGARGFRATAVIQHAASQAPHDIVSELEALAKKCTVIAAVAPEHPTITAAVQQLQEDGVPVFSLLSDFAAGVRQGYLGVDNVKVGRTAAWMIAKCTQQAGTVALFVGSHRFNGHELREIGFRAYFREEAAQFIVLDTMVNLESKQLTHDALLELRRRHPDLVGCYIAGGGMEGAISALKLMEPERRPTTVCNEITVDSRAALADNLLTMVMATPVAQLSREAVAMMAETARADRTAARSQVFLPFDIYLPENV